MRQSSKDNYMLSPSQVMSLITSTIIGVGVLTLPRSVSESAHQSGWISVLISGFLMLLLLWSIVKIGQHYPGVSLLFTSEGDGSTNRAGKLGRIIILLILFFYIVYWLFVTAGVARTFGEVVVTAVLVRTPLEVIVGTMLFLAFIMVLYDLEVMTRVNEALLPIIIIPLLFIALLAFQSADFIRLMPLVAVDRQNLLKGAVAATFSFQGFELIALYLGHLNAGSKQTRRAALLGVSIPILVYVLIVIAGIASFGYEELERLIWPTLELVKTTEVPGLILERLESAFLGVWVAAVFTTIANYFFSACFAVKKLLRLRTHRYLAVGILPVLYYLAMWPENVHQLFDYMQYLGYVGLGTSLFVPVFLLAVGILYGKKEKAPKQGEGEP